MKLFLPIAILICLIFLIRCNNESTIKSKDIEELVIKDKPVSCQVEFEKEKSIRIEGLNFAILYLDWEGVNIQTFSGDRKAIIKKFDRNLNSLRDIEFNLGQGPGDLGGGTYFFQAPDAILAPDNIQRRVNIFDKDYNFKKFIKLDSYYVGGTFSEDGMYIAGLGGASVKGGLSAILSLSTFPGLKNVMKYTVCTYNLFNEQKRVISGSNPNLRFFFRDGKLYLLNSGEYSVTAFNMEGKILKRIRVAFDNRKVPKDMKRKWLIEHNGERTVERLKLDFMDEVPPASTAIPLGKGFAVVRRKDFSVYCNGTAEADYFDYQLNLIGKTDIPCFERIFAIMGYHRAATHEYENGYFYLVRQVENEEEDAFYLEKWRVTE